MSGYQKHFLRLMVSVLSIIYLSVTSKFWCNKLIAISTSFPHACCRFGQKVLCTVCPHIRNSSFRCTDQCQVLGADFSVEFRAPPSRQCGGTFHALRTMPRRQVIARVPCRKLPSDALMLTHRAISYATACREPLGHILAASSKAWKS